MGITDTFARKATCVRVIDADTLVLQIDLGYRVTLQVEGRLNGVDAPELSTPAGQAARAAIVTVLSTVQPLTVVSFHDRRTFARWVVDVYLNDGQSLAQLLIDRGMVKAARRVEA